MTTVYYASAFAAMLQGQVNYLTDDIRVMLVKDSYSPDTTNHLTLNQVLPYEASGSGYTSYGQTLHNRTLHVDSTNQKIVFDADDAVWSNSSITARYAVIYKYTGDPTTSVLLHVLDANQSFTSGASDFLAQWPVTGIATFGA